MITDEREGFNCLPATCGRLQANGSISASQPLAERTFDENWQH